ncbi:MAG: YicC/YloC family endoribonuclease [Nitrospirota bacterium]
MTGFGSSANDNFMVEIRSLNHRFMDIFLKLPPYMSQHEMALRSILKERFKRGRFDIAVTTARGKGPTLSIDRNLAKSLYLAMIDFQKEMAIPGEVRIETLAGIKELFTEAEPEYSADELFAVFYDAVSQLENMRIREGSLLVEELRKRLGTLEDMCAKIKDLAPGDVRRWQQKFVERLRSILDTELADNTRLLQEAALMAEKLDIAEEIARLESHIRQFGEVLSNETFVGKRLDFLLQEMGREVNTLSYKAGDYTISGIVVETKTEIEKMREQVQNLQ